MNRLRYIVLIAFAALFAAGLVACGGGDDQDPQEVIDETFKPGKDYSSGIVDISAALDAGEQGTFTADVEGPFQSTPGAFPKFDLQADVSIDGGGQNFGFTGGLTSTGDTAFVNVQDTDYEVDKQTFTSFSATYLALQEQTEQEEQEEGVDFLTDLSNEGEEEIEGVDTVHIRGTADVDKLIENARQTSTDELPSGDRLDQFREAVQTSDVDVWSSKDGNRLQKIEFAVEFAQPDSEEALNLDFALTFSDLGSEQTVSAPSEAQPLSALLERYGIDPKSLRNALSGAGAGAPAGSGAADPGATSQVPAPPTGDATQGYLECLQTASGPEAVQACSDELE